MYKVLIVDDEKYVRKSIKARIDWDILGLKVVGEAGDGQSAYQSISALKPDIVLVDIRMPLISGLELIKKVKKEYPHTKFVILSGYDDFEYTKQAIKLDVVDYIKKPINDSELNEVLKKLCNDLDHEAKIKKTMLSIFKKAEEDSNAIKEGRLKQFVFNGRADTTGLTFKWKGFTVVLMYVSNLDEEGPNHVNNDPCFKYINEAVDVIEKSIENHNAAFYLLSNENRPFEYCLLINSDDVESRFTINLAKKIEAYWKNVLHNGEACPTLYFAISPPYNSLNDIHRAYRTAFSLLKNKIIYPNERIITPNMLKHNNSGSTFSDMVRSMIKSLSEYIEKNEFKKAIKILESLLDSSNVKHMNIDLLNEIVLTLASTLIKTAMTDKAQAGTSPIEELLKPDYLLNFNTLRELYEELYNLILIYIPDETVSQYDIVSKIKAHIESNYADKLSLQRLADTYHVNYSYLSQLFKKETGISFSTYLENYRINVSRKLLLETGLPINHIAMSVGYSDANYFCKVFKKHTGQNPSDYRSISVRNLK